MTVSQDSEGLLSPFLRNLRVKAVTSHIAPNEVILDLGCGSGFISDFLPVGVSYYGVDRFPFWRDHGKKDRNGKRCFFVADLEVSQSFVELHRTLDVEADTIVIAAFLEHVSDPARFLLDCVSLLKPGGRIVGTTPHPIGRKIHDILSIPGIVSRSGAKEHHKFLDRRDLEKLSTEIGGQLTLYKRLLVGLNQLFVISMAKTSLR